MGNYYIENERFIEVVNLLINEGKIINKSDLAQKISNIPQNIYDIFSHRVKVSSKILDELEIKFNISKAYIMLGEGTIFKNQNNKTLKSDTNKNLIPFYNIITIGGNNGNSAIMDGCSQPVGYVDIGSLFKGANMGAYHYGDSMIEYPNGCKIFGKQVDNLELVVFGKSYIIETLEYRVTKRLQKGDDNFFWAYSSNKETYPDGRQIHEPFIIPKKDIRRLFIVLGFSNSEMDLIDI